MVRKGIKILFIVLFLFLLYSSGYLTFEKYRTGDIISRQNMISDTIWKLQQDGYKKEDILSIGINYSWMKSQTYETAVMFKDEPDVTYYYFWNKKSSSIEQGGYSGKATKHKTF
ncbi:DUF3139 domain-containing protein [Paenibacillus sp. LMG 31458]|uniref:DUF3139 domain-containing protein n=1 Tax=Paenibacillus phytorum TaxID=2654977 RepID=A0ABX1XTR5_9BACL|nr:MULTISPECIES: DUF3139 domain-containing protein [Paenibacillus]KRF31686.1 hypothetical protein ASG93_04940 [Paenibacillus sp. Soil787]NOU71774.1 DUF3139 domain-containing protein [Paenibacillus phytorum]